MMHFVVRSGALRGKKKKGKEGSVGDSGWSSLCLVRQGGVRVKLLRIMKHVSPSVPKLATRIVPGEKKKS